MKLNPQFPPLDILSHTKQLNESLIKESNPFPVDVFPPLVQSIIKETNHALNYPVDFTGASILFAVSVAIGNTFKAEIMTEFQQNAVIYLAIVGRAGTNKSHPLSFALSPIYERDNEKFKQYQDLMNEYLELGKLNKTEKKKRGLLDKKQPKKPNWEQLLVSDITPESLAAVHACNTRGLGVYVDELASWFNNFNRYNKGSEEQFWLSNWSGKALRINRKTSEPINIPMPFISVAGTIQPAVLNQLATNRTENGFIDRILFVFPENLQKEYWSETCLSPEVSQNWKTIFENLLNHKLKLDDSGNPNPEILRFNAESKQLIFDWQRKNTDQANNSESEVVSSICAKIEQYVIRFSLVLQLLQNACSEGGKTQIEVEAVSGAIKLAEYFKMTAIRVQTMLTNETPVDRLPTNKKQLYEALPDEFSTAEGLEIAKSLDIPERTFKRFLNDDKLFEKALRGKYVKKF